MVANGVLARLDDFGRATPIAILLRSDVRSSSAPPAWVMGTLRLAKLLSGQAPSGCLLLLASGAGLQAGCSCKFPLEHAQKLAFQHQCYPRNSHQSSGWGLLPTWTEIAAQLSAGAESGPVASGGSLGWGRMAATSIRFELPTAGWVAASGRTTPALIGRSVVLVPVPSMGHRNLSLCHRRPFSRALVDVHLSQGSPKSSAVIKNHPCATSGFG